MFFTRKRDFTEDTSIWILWEGGRCSYILSTVWICSIDFTLARCDSAWNRSTAVGGGAKSLNVNTKDHHFVTPSWISVHSVHTTKFTIGGGATCGLYLVWTAQSVYRVCIVHEIVGVGGLFEWGGLARELPTLMEVLWSPRHPRGGAVKARYEKTLCVQNTSTSSFNKYCTAPTYTNV